MNAMTDEQVNQIASEAASVLHACGYLYLGIRDAPKPMTGAIAIIATVIKRHLNADPLAQELQTLVSTPAPSTKTKIAVPPQAGTGSITFSHG